MVLAEWLKDSIHELRVFGVRSIASSQELVEHNKRLLIKLCPHFRRQGISGLCNASEVVCKPSKCSNLRSCGRICIPNCIAANAQTSEIENFDESVSTGLEVLGNEIKGLKLNQNSAHHLDSVLLPLERKIIDCLSFWPGDLMCVSEMRESIKTDESEIKQPENTPSEQETLDFDLAWRYFVSKIMLEQLRNLIANGDSKILVQSSVREQVQQLIETSPMKFIERLLGLSPQANVLKDQSVDMELFESSKMNPVVEWCIRNEMEFDISRYESTRFIARVDRNKLENQEIGYVPARKRFEASYLLFNTLFNVCRSLYFSKSCALFKGAVEAYKDLSARVPQSLTGLMSPYFWDEIVWNLDDKDDLVDLVEKLGSIPESMNYDGWPIQHQGNILPGSALLFLFTSVVYGDLVSTNSELGRIFEDTVNRELELLRIPVLERNLELPTPPAGELDHICYDYRAVYLIEAKDYGARSRQGYFSSSEYSERIITLQNYLDKFENRLKWFDENRERYDIPNYLPVKGIFLTSYEEPHLESTDERISVSSLRGLGEHFTSHRIEPRIYRGQHSIPDVAQFKKEHPEVPIHLDGWKNEKDEQIAFIEGEIEKDFGSMEAFKLYRYCWEMIDARVEGTVAGALRSFGMSELVATEGQGFGSVCHIWDGLYVTYILEMFNWEELVNAAEKLCKDGFFSINDQKQINIDNHVPTKMYSLINGEYILTSNEDDADVILYPTFRKQEGGIMLSGMTDGMLRRSGELMPLEMKLF